MKTEWKRVEGNTGEWGQEFPCHVNEYAQKWVFSYEWSAIVITYHRTSVSMKLQLQLLIIELQFQKNLKSDFLRRKSGRELEEPPVSEVNSLHVSHSSWHNCNCWLSHCFSSDYRNFSSCHLICHPNATTYWDPNVTTWLWALFIPWLYVRCSRLRHLYLIVCPDSWRCEHWVMRSLSRCDSLICK